MQSLHTALADITEASDDCNLTSNHDVGCTLDAVDEGLSAAVQVVELRLRDRVVDVDGWCEKTMLFAFVLQHAV